MSELIAEHPHPYRSKDGREYNVSVRGEQRGHLWSGWIEFTDVKSGKTLKTDQETSQPNRAAVEYWATGIEDIYLEGALSRAK